MSKTKKSGIWVQMDPIQKALIKEALQNAGMKASEVLLAFAEDYKKSPAYINKVRAMMEELKEMGIEV